MVALTLRATKEGKTREKEEIAQNKQDQVERCLARSDVSLTQREASRMTPVPDSCRIHTTNSNLDVVVTGDICLTYNTGTYTIPQICLACGQTGINWRKMAEIISLDLGEKVPKVVLHLSNFRKKCDAKEVHKMWQWPHTRHPIKNV